MRWNLARSTGARFMTFEPNEIILGLGLALVAGGLIGLERERHALVERKETFGGARTFPMIALLGALLGLWSASAGIAIFAIGFVALALLIALGTIRARNDGDSAPGPGLTSEIAALLVYTISAIPFAGDLGIAFPERILLAAALATVTTALLALREPIHEFAGQLSKEDLIATVRFALIAVVALPLLPNEQYGPFDALNPFKIGVVIVLVAGISFLGYIAVRVLGPRRGFGITALFGGLVSSTAVTLALSARGRQHPELAPACALGIALASTVMFARVLVEVFVIRPELVGPAAIPLGAMLVAGALGCFLLWRRIANAPANEPPKGLHNPFRLREAFRLGLVYAAVRFATAAAWSYFGSRGLLVSAGISGLADVDAITISVAGMHEGGLETRVAVMAITLAAATNTFVKAALAFALGSTRMGLGVAYVVVPAAVTGGLLSVLMW